MLSPQVRIGGQGLLLRDKERDTPAREWIVIVEIHQSFSVLFTQKLGDPFSPEVYRMWI